MSGIVGSAGRSGVIGRTHGGIKEMDMWRITSAFTGDADPLLTANLERTDTYFDKIGTGMSVSSGKWTFPSTGIWCVDANFTHYSGSEDRDIRMTIMYSSNDGGAWSIATLGDTNCYDSSAGNVHTSTYLTAILDITDTSNQKVGFKITKSTGGSVSTDGGTNENITSFLFTRLGDT